MVQAGRLAVVDPLWPPRPQPALPPKQGPCGGQQGHPRASGASPRQGPKRSPGRHACARHGRVRQAESSRNPSSFCKSVHYIKCYGPETRIGSIGFPAIYKREAFFLEGAPIEYLQERGFLFLLEAGGKPPDPPLSAGLARPPCWVRGREGLLGRRGRYSARWLWPVE